MLQYLEPMHRFVFIFFILTACTGEDPVDQETGDSVDWLMANTSSYLEDSDWRRAELEASMWRPDLPYAQKRLDAYALPSGGWDRLREFNPSVMSVGKNPQLTTFEPNTPASREEWLELGEKVFWNLPMRRDGYLDHLIDSPELMQEIGIQTDPSGNIRGLVRYDDAFGKERVGLTCGFCHGDQGIAGAANQDLDLGRARSIVEESLGVDSGNAYHWGPGAVDVTDDNVNDPVAIPNLWNLEDQQYINRSAAVALASPASIAIRFETQYIEGQSMTGRPSRVLTWALAMFVYSLDAGTSPEIEGKGFDLFIAECGSCHRPEQAYGGGLIPAEALNSNPKAAHSGLRGTGFYKVPTLIGASNSKRFMNDATVESMAGVLSIGHPTGQTLSPDDEKQLLQFLNSL